MSHRYAALFCAMADSNDSVTDLSESIESTSGESSDDQVDKAVDRKFIPTNYECKFTMAWFRDGYRRYSFE